MKHIETTKIVVKDKEVKCKDYDGGRLKDEYWECEEHQTLFEPDDIVLEVREEGSAWPRLLCPILVWSIFGKKPCRNKLYSGNLEYWRKAHTITDIKNDKR